MTNLAVIIARAGSKGLPNKAMQLLAGKPLIAYTIEHALGSKCVDAVVVSSDSPEILAVGRRFGLSCYDRPPEVCGDSATIDSPVRHAVPCWEHDTSNRVDHVAILYGNIPLRPRDLTDRALDKLVETGGDSVQSVCPVGKMHPLWMKRVSDDDQLMMYEDNRVYRRQDLPPVYMLDAGVLAVTRKSLFSVDPAEPHAFLGDDRRAVVTQPGQVVDVDDALDLALAEVLLRHAMQNVA